MSVLIPGMEMPKGCASCKISRRNGKKMICPFIWKCEWDIHDPMSADHRLDGCPLVPVPEHGRLIDADALPQNRMTFNGVRFIKERFIKEASVVIPSDKEGEG